MAYLFIREPLVFEDPDAEFHMRRTYIPNTSIKTMKETDDFRAQVIR